MEVEEGSRRPSGVQGEGAKEEDAVGVEGFEMKGLPAERFRLRVLSRLIVLEGLGVRGCVGHYAVLPTVNESQGVRTAMSPVSSTWNGSLVEKASARPFPPSTRLPENIAPADTTRTTATFSDEMPIWANLGVAALEIVLFNPSTHRHPFAPRTPMRYRTGWRQWLKALRALAGDPRPASRPRPPQPFFIPIFDSLEDRLVPTPAATVQFGLVHESLLDTAGNFSIPVSLSAASASNVSVPYTLDGTAASGTDYSGVANGTLVIPAGQLAVNLTGTLLPAADGAKALTITLGTPANATLGANTTNTLAITDPAASPTTFVIANSTAIEPAGNGTVNMAFTVTRTGDLTSQVTVGYTTVDGTAHGGTDFTPAAGNVTFASGAANATIGIPIFNNGVADNPNLSFSVQLTGVVNVVGPAVTFAGQASFAAGARAFSVAVGDVNGDGKPDIVTANYHANSVSVLLNTGAAALPRRPSQASKLSPSARIRFPWRWGTSTVTANRTSSPSTKVPTPSRYY